MPNNIQVADANGVVQTVSTTFLSNVHTPHHIVDSGTVTISNFPTVQGVELVDSGGTNKASISTTGAVKIAVFGNNGATVDSTITAGTAPTNAIATSLVYNTTPPAPTNTQALVHQADWQGSLFVRPARRSATVAQASVISSVSTPVTALAAQASGVFSDISTVVMTVTAAASADIAFTVTLSDGTASYVFDLDTGALSTAVAAPPPLVINFNVPLPATTAATAWTVTSSSASVTVHITLVAVLQKIS